MLADLTFFDQGDLVAQVASIECRFESDGASTDDDDMSGSVDCHKIRFVLSNDVCLPVVGMLSYSNMKTAAVVPQTMWLRDRVHRQRMPVCIAEINTANQFPRV